MDNLNSVTVLSTLLGSGLLYYAISLFLHPTLDFPSVGGVGLWIRRALSGRTAFFYDIHEDFLEGYDKIQKPSQKPFRVSWWAREYLLLPPKYLVDFKKADSAHLSFCENISEAFSLHCSVGDMYCTNVMVNVVNRYLNPQLPSLMTHLVEECDFALKTDIGDCKDWKSLKAAELFDSLILRMTSRVMASADLARDERYLKTVQPFLTSIFMNGLILSSIPFGPFRPIGIQIGSYFHRRILNRLLSVVEPAVQSRMAERERLIAEGGLDPSQQLYEDAIDWTIIASNTDSSCPQEWKNARGVAMQLVHNIWAAASAPAGLVTRALYQILLEKEKYAKPLIDECRAVREEYGWGEKAFGNMPLLDSFLREVNRRYPTGSVTCARTIKGKPYQFNDGLVLPAGTRIGIPAMAIQRDADNFDDPLKFDGFRFARLHASQSDLKGPNGSSNSAEHTWGASTVTTTNLAFGYGKHACPGRWLAIRAAKILLSKILLEYDVEWDGEVVSRPKDFSINGQFAPNLEQKIRFRQQGADGK